MMKMFVTRSCEMGGLSFDESRTLTAVRALEAELTIPAAIAGELTTRNADDDAIMTLPADHGLEENQRVDVFWEGGKRYRMNVGEVAGVSVPITGGDGDPYPIASTDVLVSLVQSETFEFAGDDLEALVHRSEGRGIIILADAEDVELYVFEHELAKSVKIWHDGDGTVNPVAGDAVAKVYMSSAADEETTSRIGALLN